MRAIALTIAVLALPLGGCLRLSYDLCAPERMDRHPECDASRPIDSGSNDGGASDDAGTEDAGASDAGDVGDAGIDAAVAVDSGLDDAGLVTPDAGPLDAALDAD